MQSIEKSKIIKKIVSIFIISIISLTKIRKISKQHEFFVLYKQMSFDFFVLNFIKIKKLYKYRIDNNVFYIDDKK